MIILFCCISGLPIITSFTSNRDTLALTCISSGGPATTVTWMNNNEILNIDGNHYRQTQTLTDTEHATYENILYFNDPSNLVGYFTCTVHNTRGNSSKSLSTDGIIHCFV